VSKYYSPQEIDRLIENVPFEKVLEYYSYPVKGRGKNRGSICPFCSKNHEHFKINTQRNLANCFVCKWSGNAIQFIQEVEKLSFIPAVEKYASIGNFELKPEINEPSNNLKYKILNATAQFYSQFETDYLDRRGISKDVQKQALIGYAQGGVSLKKHLNNLSFTDDELLEVGVIRKRSNNRLMDYFYNCVIIPIYKNGRIVDLYGRYTEKGNTKHVYLYGHPFFYNLEQCNPKKPIIIVESIINQLTLKSNGITNVGAVGSCERFTKNHVKELVNLGFKAAFIGFDTGDKSKAGQQGAIKASELLHTANIVNRIIEMPKNTDINELYLTYDKPNEVMKHLILNSVESNKFKAKLLLDQIDIEWIENYLKERIKRTKKHV